LEWCRDNTYGHIETSAKDGTGIQAAMQSVALLALEAKRNYVSYNDSSADNNNRGFRIQLEGKYSASQRGSCCEGVE